MEKTRDELIKYLNIKLSELNDLQKTETMLADNTCEFEHQGKTYHIRRLKGSEKDELALQRAKKYGQLLFDPDFKFRKQLVALLKEKGVDIEHLEGEQRREYLKEQDILRRLGKCEIESDVNKLVAEVEASRTIQKGIFLDIQDHMSTCIEKNLEDFGRMYMLYLLLEVKNGDKWERICSSFKELQDYEDEMLLGRAAGILAVLVYHDEL
jgi:hypothetical protein